MGEDRLITSLTNDTVKAVRALHMRKQRDATGTFLAEGLKFIGEALDQGRAPRMLLVGQDARARVSQAAPGDRAARLHDPGPDHRQPRVGRRDGKGRAPAVALVAAALALATAMQATGLHRRLALYVLKLAGEKVSNIVIGAIAISIILAFFVPSATARAGAVVPILMGMVAAFGLPKGSKLAALLVITAAQAVSPVAYTCSWPSTFR